MKKKILIFSFIYFLLCVIFGFSSDQFLDITVQSDLNNFRNENALFFFLSNLTASFLAMTGLFLLGIPTAILLFFNSFILGTALSWGIREKPLFDVLWAIIPHGIFEIPAIILSSYIGFLGFIFYQQENKIRLVKHVIKISILIICLLIISAIVESSISVPLNY